MTERGDGARREHSGRRPALAGPPGSRGGALAAAWGVSGPAVGGRPWLVKSDRKALVALWQDGPEYHPGVVASREGPASCCAGSTTASTAGPPTARDPAADAAVLEYVRVRPGQGQPSPSSPPPTSLRSSASR